MTCCRARCGALLAQGLAALDARPCAAYLHGRAGALSRPGGPTRPPGVLEAWPDAVREAAAAADGMDGSGAA